MSLIAVRSIVARVVFGAAALAVMAGPVSASIVATPDPVVPDEIGARMRWGATGFEASLLDNSPLNQNPTLNPSGAPAWQLGSAYKFQVNFDGTSGALGMSVDFNLNGSFESGESISRTAFSSPGLTSYLNQGFEYISISGNEGGSTGRSKISNLSINGDAQGDIEPGGTFSKIYYKDSSGNVITPINIMGNLTFLTAGTAQERPSWNILFAGPDASSGTVAVPEPSTLISTGIVGVLGIGLAWRRRKTA